MAIGLFAEVSENEFVRERHPTPAKSDDLISTALYPANGAR